MAYDGREQAPEAQDRRRALAALGLGALTALAGSSLAGGARAQEASATKLASVSNSQSAAARLMGSLPASTPITELGLPPAAAARLTPAARRLTKADLLSLDQNGGTSPVAAKLSAADVLSISAAFNEHPQLMAESKSSSSNSHPASCCCCSLACSCCAATDHHSLVA